MFYSTDNPILLAMKWSLMTINISSALFVCVPFFTRLLQRKSTEGISIAYVFNCCIVGFVASMGAYAAYTQNPHLLTLYGIALLINLILGRVSGLHVYEANLGLYALSIGLSFLYSYFLRHGAPSVNV